jgi:hypothetical protein
MARQMWSRNVAIVSAVVFAVTVIPAEAAPGRTYMVDGGDQKLTYKPKSWAAGGVGASARMETITWTRWGSKKAVATGTTVNNACDPSCAEGTTYRYPGTLTLTRPRYCRSGSHRFRYFTIGRYTIDLPADNGFGLSAGKHTTTFTWPTRYSSGFCRR